MGDHLEVGKPATWSTQPSIQPGEVNLVSAPFWLGLTCVGWQVTLCDVIRSSDVCTP